MLLNKIRLTSSQSATPKLRELVSGSTRVTTLLFVPTTIHSSISELCVCVSGPPVERVYPNYAVATARLIDATPPTPATS
jgi:hypothetical protein